MIRLGLILFNFIISFNLFCQIDGFEDSYKRQIQLGKIDKSKTEIYDPIARNYSNYKYSFSFKHPKSWSFDNGVGLFTVFRTFQKDSGISISVNILESIDKKVPSLHKVFDELGEVFYKKGIEKQLENSGVNIKDVFFKKSFFKGFDCINQEYITSEILEDFELETIHIGKIFWKQNIQFTIGFNLPKIYYDLKPSYYDNLIYDFNILQNYDGVEFTDNKKFIVNGKDIRQINTYSLKNMVRYFFDDCHSKGINISIPKDLYAKFDNSLSNETLGISNGKDRNDIVYIRINPKAWSKASNQKKWYLIYHELGHDVFNFEHGEGGKMMFTFIDREYSWEEFFQDKEYMFNYFKKNQ